MIGELVAGPVRVGDHNVQVRPQERQVVVAAVPENHIAVNLRPPQDLLVVDPREHDRALAQVRLILLPLLDRHLVTVEVIVGLEPLHPLLAEVAVGHRVTDDHRLAAELPEPIDYVAGRLALAGSRAHRAHGNHRSPGLEHRVPRPQEHEAGARG